jgi:hypothetical protein
MFLRRRTKAKCCNWNHFTWILPGKKRKICYRKTSVEQKTDYEKLVLKLKLMVLLIQKILTEAARF